MIRITFKNVDQGDSILLEWNDDGIKKIGVIDCKKAFRTNPVLDHIKNNGYKRIEFLILSHPHTDHFSGFSDLIKFCIDSNIPINYFLHTSNNIKEFWNIAVNGGNSKSEALKLFSLIREAKDKIGMSFFPIQGETIHSAISIGKDYFLKILGPTSVELDKFINEKVIDEEEHGNNPSANWLSTLIKIYSTEGEWFVLLTSDVYDDLLYYYSKKKNVVAGNPNTLDELKGLLVLGQSPHHGSKVNHRNAFWKNLKRNDNTPIVFSAGRNTYGHPSEEVVDFFRKNKFKLYCTNPIGPFGPKLSNNGKENIANIESFSIKVSGVNEDYEGDKIFDIDIKGIVTKIP